MANSNESPKDKPSSPKQQNIIEGDGEGHRMLTQTDNGGKEGHDDVEDEQMLTQTDNGGGSSSSSLITAGGKRGRGSADGVDVGASGSKARKKGEMEVPAGAKPRCYVCKKVFVSWKAVFGHLRAHQRQTPGAFPPPSFTPPEGSPRRNNNYDQALKEQLAPTLLNLAYEIMRKTSAAAGPGGASSSRRGRGRGLDIDLNQPSTSFVLDLNEPPLPEQEDDDDYDEYDHV